MELSFAFSPCPNDTFIFEAIINKRLSQEELTVRAVMMDVENLNNAARQNMFDVTKLSCSAFPFIKIF